MTGERIRVAHAADEDELGGEGADTRETLELVQGILQVQPTQAAAAERSVEAGGAEGAQLLDLEFGQSSSGPGDDPGALGNGKGTVVPESLWRDAA